MPGSSRLRGSRSASKRSPGTRSNWVRRRASAPASCRTKETAVKIALSWRLPVLHLSWLCLVALAFCTFAHPASAQIYKLAEMNAEQIAALDRSRTAVILTGGILEQHGPHLPSFSDGYLNEWYADGLAERIVARPGWKVLRFPTIPLGSGGANEIGRQFVAPGTYAVR